MKYVIETDIPNPTIFVTHNGDLPKREAYSDPEPLTAKYVNENFGDLHDAAYRKGMTDAWNVAKKLVESTPDERKELFGGYYSVNIIRENDFERIKQKLDEYEVWKNGIKVGDEVRNKRSDLIGVVVLRDERCGESAELSVLWRDGSVGKWNETDFVKTNRHFPQVEQLLKEMKK